MTNTFFQVVVWVLWSTNQMDVLLTPSGDDVMRNFIAVQHHVYNLPGYPSVTNSVPVATNSMHMKWGWMEVKNELPPVPRLPAPYVTNGYQFDTNSNIPIK